jgi:hypothetical protein
MEQGVLANDEYTDSELVEDHDVLCYNAVPSRQYH